MEIQIPLVIFTSFLAWAAGIFGTQCILALQKRGGAVQLPALICSAVVLVVGGIAVVFHLTHPFNLFNGFGHITSGITIELIFVIVFAIAVVLYFLMMRRSEEGVAPKWCAILAIVVSLALPFATGDSYLMSAIPVWDTMLLPLYYVVATVMLGGLAAIPLREGIDICKNVLLQTAGIYLIIAGATKAEDAVKLSATVAFIGAVVCAVVSVIYAVAISGMGANYTEMQYYFDPTLPDVAMRQSEQITGAILAGEHAVAFWLGNVVIGCAVPAVLAALVMCGKVPAEKALAVAVIALVCAVIGTIVWRVLLYEVAVNALIQFQWAL